MSAQVLFDAPGPRARRNIAIGNGVGVIGALAVLAVVIWVMAQNGQFTAAKWQPMIEADTWRYYFLPGLQNTLVAAAYSIVLAMIFGLAFGTGRLASNAAVRWFCGVVVEFFRAVPVLIMMIAAWFIAARTTDLVPDTRALFGVIVGLTLYNGSVIAELVRSGVHGLPSGQREAALAIGMTRGQSIRAVELPQALLAMLPSLVSQFVVVLKDTALGYAILYSELLKNAREIGSGPGFPMLQAMFVITIIYIVLNSLLSAFAERLALRIGSRTAGAAKTPTAQPSVAAGGGQR